MLARFFFLLFLFESSTSSDFRILLTSRFCSLYLFRPSSAIDELLCELAGNVKYSIVKPAAAAAAADTGAVLLRKFLISFCYQKWNGGTSHNEVG